IRVLHSFPTRRSSDLALGRAHGRGLHRTTNLSRTTGHRMSARKRYWLMKSEPTDFSIDDLQRVGTEPWTGVRNYQARNSMRDDRSEEHTSELQSRENL